MHAETFAYLLHALSIDQKHIPSVAPLPQSAFPIQVMLEIPGGTVTLGQPTQGSLWPPSVWMGQRIRES